MYIILLSGGSGKRLWPLSNDVRAKQFLKIFKTPDNKCESMLQRMTRMIKEVNYNSNITIAAPEAQVNIIKEQLGNEINISIEPCRIKILRRVGRLRHLELSYCNYDRADVRQRKNL